MTQSRCAAARSTRACQRSVSSSTPFLIASWSMPSLLCRDLAQIRATRPQGQCGQMQSSDANRLFGLEIHRHAIDAIAQSGRRGAVREDVAEMTAAAAAMAFSAHHAVAAVMRLFDRAGLGVIEARPAGAAL